MTLRWHALPVAGGGGGVCGEVRYRLHAAPEGVMAFAHQPPSRDPLYAAFDAAIAGVG